MWRVSFSLGVGRCLAVGAQAPERDLGLVDHEAAGVGRRQAGRLADDAVDVAIAPHERQTTWWWLSPTRVS